MADILKLPRQKTVTVADKTIVDKQIFVTVPDVEYGSSPVPKEHLREMWMEMRHGLTRTVWMVEIHGVRKHRKQWESYLVKTFYEDDSQKGREYFFLEYYSQNGDCGGHCTGGKIYDGRTDVNVRRSVSFGGLANEILWSQRIILQQQNLKNANAGNR